MRSPLDQFPSLFLLGDVFFRDLVVVHDLNDPRNPLVGIAPRRLEYLPTQQGDSREARILRQGGSPLQSVSVLHAAR